MNTPQGFLLNTTAAAAALDVSPGTMRRWRRLGVGPAFIRCGQRKIAYEAQELGRYLAGRTNMPAPRPCATSKQVASDPA
jgi:hypothetical protein